MRKKKKKKKNIESRFFTPMRNNIDTKKKKKKIHSNSKVREREVNHCTMDEASASSCFINAERFGMRSHVCKVRRSSTEFSFARSMLLPVVKATLVSYYYYYYFYFLPAMRSLFLFFLRRIMRDSVIDTDMAPTTTALLDHNKKKRE